MKAQLNEYIAMINKAMDEYLVLPETQIQSLPVLEAMRYSALDGGKRVRPVMTLAFCALCGGNADVALPFACAVEMIHTYSLVHDDLPCMDNDTVRRGKPTNHVAFGEATALLAGDGLLTKAFEVIAKADAAAPQAVKAIALLAELAGTEGMVGGQCIDLASEGKQADVETLRQMDMGKTVALISAACQLGCVAAGADENALRAAKQYAGGVGMAFQIRDDILGMAGDSSVLGKTVGLDTQSDKSNYVRLLGVEKAQELVETYTAEALKALSMFSGNTIFLRELALSLVNREL